jgi:hypothetical protein
VTTAASFAANVLFSFQLTLTNTGTAPAKNVSVNSAFMGDIPANGGLGRVGQIPNGSSAHVLLTFPAGVPLGTVYFGVAGFYSGSGFSGSIPIQVLAH